MICTICNRKVPRMYRESHRKFHVRRGEVEPPKSKSSVLFGKHPKAPFITYGEFEKYWRKRKI